MHIPVLLKESIDNLNLKEKDIVVDATVNRGGHSLSIAKKIGKGGTLICIDLDEEALKEAEKFLDKNLNSKNRPNIFFINNNFRNLKKILEDLKINKIDALIADLGVSSQEIDISGRGFSFQRDEPLLMTLKDKIEKDDLTAKYIVNNWQEETLADIIYYYSDERYAKRIARNIVEERKSQEIKTTFDLIDLISMSVPNNYKYGKIHFATKTFQAIRIATNDEIGAEGDLLSSLKDVLKENSRASIITFHSGEDRVLKNFIKDNKEILKLVKFENNKVFLEPTREEIKDNVRSRSAKLRIIEKK
ncbi:MAG: 16S rRNA (cytosine(1402)-N(4))-methyltransferase RsmH [Candidatus Pacebacteria bacterium]|nr:16S rRNA (cytosine(1402)-N(4))-methyltransferase RsmH [Candidatus Paceibacterota bacterium]